MTSCIVGWAHTKFGKVDEDVEALMTRVACDAIADAGLSPPDVDAIYVGHYNGGFSPQDFTASLALQADEAFRFKPATRLENACATGSAAIHAGLDRIAARRRGIVLVIGVEKMTAVDGARVGDILLGASYRKEEGDTPGGFAGVFGRIANLYFQQHGDQREALARIAAKNHRNGAANPYAHIRKDLGFEFCNTVSDRNPEVAAPLRRTDCSLVSDGAAALVLADLETALRLPKAVAVRAHSHVNDLLPLSRRDATRFSGAERAWARALSEARLDLLDLDLVETHDCFTIAELIEYEAMGLTAPGRGAVAITEGWTEKTGKLPVNPSGGLKAKGHPIGATGVSMHVMAAMQLCGDAGDMQVENAELAGVFNMGGAAVANYVSILQRLR